MKESWPEAYKKGFQDFYGYDFKVTPDTLIPRPETEMMIDAILNLAGKPYLAGVKPGVAEIPETATILDVGTGSGCIAITIKLKLKNATVIASDISEKALKVARENADKLGAKVKFIKSDLLSEIDFTPDVIVANLPYVDKKWDWLDLKALSNEPETALFAKDHGLELIKKLIDQLPEQTNYLILEADPSQHTEICEYAKDLTLLEKRGFILTFRRNLLR